MKISSLFTIHLVSLFILMVITIPGKSQEEKTSPVDLGADLMSRYVWRGTDYGASPSIQPFIEFGLSNFSLGVWGAYTTNNPGIQEVDLYANFTMKELLTISCTDYFFPDEIRGYNYYEFRKDSSAHIIEGMLKFNGTENLPLTLMAGINIYNDPDNSVYFEAGYSLSVLNLFVGAGNGFYTTDGKFNFINIGISATKDLPITEKYSLPLSASFITNPQAGRVYLVFGVSF
ncbi:MAG: hypothetical protein AMS27_14605 [Bacteroides sp. SM23_62_1]|nr:MAG: hypothetical protein AMS27_14605 [Bacteroides sp. SM23_62_1]